ncbi:MAG: hypothetical protein VW886_05105 [Candidatus Heimdallarchaeota archaeon]
MTYIENALYDFIKNILKKGIIILKNPDYIAYSIYFVVGITFTTIVTLIYSVFPIDMSVEFMDLLLDIELSIALSFLIVGLIFSKLEKNKQVILITALIIGFNGLFLLLNDILIINNKIIISIIFYIFWISISIFSSFALIRDLFNNDVLSTILFLGKPYDDGRPVFRFFVFILAIFNTFLGFFIYDYGIEQNSNAFIYLSIIIFIMAAIAIIPLINLQKKYDVFFTIISLFYAMTTIRVMLIAFRSLNSGSGDISFGGTVLSLFIAIYTVQGLVDKTMKIKNKDEDDHEKIAQEGTLVLFNRRFLNHLGNNGIILVILGLFLGYHSIQIQYMLDRIELFDEIAFTSNTDIAIIGYEVSLTMSLLLYVFSVVLFILWPNFRKYANPSVRRIIWAPEYEDVKLLAKSIKSGVINWKTEGLKIAKSLSASKLKGIVSNSESFEDVLSNSIDRMITDVKNEED